MKRIISVVLAVTMLMSLVTTVGATTAERSEFLNAVAAEYLEIEYTNDGFATTEEVYKYYSRDSKWQTYPSTDVEGNAITNHISNASYTKKSMSQKVFVIDSILGVENAKLTGSYLNASGAVKNYSVTMRANGNSKFVLDSTDADGTMNFLYKHNDISFKMGPIGGTGAHLTADGGYNVQVLPNDVAPYESTGTVENPKSVNILMSTHFVNGGGNAGLFPVVITYSNGDTVTKYVISTILMPNSPNRDAFLNATGGASNYDGDGDRLAKTIIYVPKSTDISTGANIAAAEAILSETNAEEIVGRAVTLDDVKFPNDDLIIKGESVLFADYNHARVDAFSNARKYCNVGYVDFLQIPVDNKVASVYMDRDTEISKNWKDENGNKVALTNSNCAYIPVTIEGASEDYYYFAKMGRLCKDDQEVYAVTIAGKSLQEEIDGIEERINALESVYNKAQNEEIYALELAIADIKTRGVLESDFDNELIAKFNSLLETAKEEAVSGEKIAAFEEKVAVMADKYSASMKAQVEEAKSAYDVLVSAGIAEAKINAELLARYKAVYGVYVVATDLERKTAPWGNEYSYTMYADVIASKELADNLISNVAAAQDAVSEGIIEKVSKFYEIAVEAKVIDNKIDELSDTYESSMTDALILIKNSVEALKTNGGTDNAINAEKLAKFNTLYAADEEYRRQQLLTKVTEVEGLMDEVGTTYEASEKEKVELAKEKYEELVKTAGASELINSSKVETFNKLYAVYEKANTLEAKVNAWPEEYTYTLYSEVMEAKEDYEELCTGGNNEALVSVVVLKINKYFDIAKDAKEADIKIAALKDDFDLSMSADLRAIKKLTDALAVYGAGEGALENKAKFETLFAEYEAQRGFVFKPLTEYVELNLFQDIFATYEEKTGSLWGKWDGTSTISDVYAFKGYGTSQEMKYPTSETASGFSKRNQYAMLINHTDTNKVTLENNERVSYDESFGRYIVTAKNGKYKLGEIAEGKKGGNFFTFGMTYDTATYPIADGIGIKEEVLDTTMYPNAGTATQIQKAVVPVNKSGVSSLNLLLTANNSSEAAFMPVTIKYTDKTTEHMWLYVGTLNKDFQEYIIAADPSYNTFADISANGVKAASVLGKNVENSEITFPASTGGMYKNSNIGCDTFYIPEESFKLATFFRSRSIYYDGYVHSFSIPVNAEKTIENITLEKMGGNLTTGYYSQIGAYCNGTGSDAAAFIPVTIANADNSYKYYIRTLRACGRAGMFAMTLSTPAIQEEIEALEARIAELPDDYTLDAKERIAAVYEDVQKLKAEKGVIDTDFDTVLIEKINRLYNTAVNDTTKTEKLEELSKLFINVPESFSLTEARKLLAIEEFIDEIFTELKLTEEDVVNAAGGQEVYDRYAEYLALYKERMETVITEDNVRFNFLKFSEQAVADIFEFSTVTNADEIPNKQGITQNGSNKDYLPSMAKKGEQIGFYATDLVREKYQTFPDKFGEYKIANAGISYIYAGVSENVGENTYNATRVTPTYSFETNLDGATEYEKISILANGVIYLTGAHARQVQAVKTTVYFADGTKKSEISFVGPFAYGYKTGIYSMKDGETYPRSEYLNKGVTSASTIDFIPSEANVDAYFNIAYGMANRNTTDTYKEFYTSKEFGNATVINIDTDNKAVKKVTIEIPSGEELEAMGAKPYSKFVYTSSGEVKEASATNTYYLPVDKAQFSDNSAFDSTREYSLAIMRSDKRPVYIHAVTGVKTTPTSYSQDIAQIEEDIKALTGETNSVQIAKMKAIESKIVALESYGIPREFIDNDCLEKLDALLNYNISEAGHYEIYVSPYGDDKEFGNKDNPVKTIERALELASEKNGIMTINIIVQEGVYVLDKTITIPAALSGTEEAPVTIKGENAIITTADYLNSADFEKLTSAERAKLQPSVADKVLKIDLSEYGINVGDVPTYSSTSILGDGFEDTSLLVNGKEQTVAQWPNGESNYETWTEIVNADINSIVMRVNARHAEKWQGEKFAYFEGHPSVDYSNERNNITFDGDLIRFQNKARYSSDEKHSRRYKVKHVLYELDVPGEWYIDRDTEVLYYYPAEGFEGGEITILSKTFDAIKTENALENFYFDGLIISGVRGSGISAGTYHENVGIYNCEFRDISNIAVNFAASNNYKSNATLSGLSNYTDAAKECEIRNNLFENIGKNAIVFKGGNRENLTDGNNVIANNYIYDASNKRKNSPVIDVNGALNYVLNNEIHMGTFHAINHSGNENVIAYNELYNMLRETGDCGVIYNGRQLATRGTEIAYNYIHDYKHLDKRTGDNGVGIYLDDRMSGIYVHHNILFGNGIDAAANGIQNGGGHHNIINYNTIVDTEESMTRANRLTEKYISDSASTAFDEIIRISGMDDTTSILLDDGTTKNYVDSSKMLGRNEFYFERYPEMNDSIETLLNPNVTVKQFVEKYPYILNNLPYGTDEPGLFNLANDIANGNDLTKYRLMSMKAPLGNVYIGNNTNTPWRDLGDEENDIYLAFGGTIENNTTATTSDYVDYEGRDFRIKSSAPSYVEGMISENFDMSLIGRQEDGGVSYDIPFELKNIEVKHAEFSQEEKEFNLISPVTGTQVADKRNVTLLWERPVSSDYFTIEIATDENMSNIIYRNENVYFATHTVDLSSYSNNKFYWRVTARNIGKDNSQSWVNADGVQSFGTDYVLNMDLYRNPSQPFDISDQFNIDVFSNEGETHNNSNNLGGKQETLGMYNLTNFKKFVGEDKLYTFLDTTYYFPQAGYDSSKNNAISTQKYSEDNTGWLQQLMGKGTSYVYTLKTAEQGKYDKIKLAASGLSEIDGYQIKLTYTDGSSVTTSLEIHQYFTTYHSKGRYDILMKPSGVNYLGGEVGASNQNKIYQISLEADESKTLKSMEFVWKSGTTYGSGTHNVYIFAITGVKADEVLSNGNTVKLIDVYCNDTATAKKLIVTGYDENGQFKTIMTDVSIISGNNTNAQVEIPAEAENLTEVQMYIWSNDMTLMKSYTPKMNIK